MLVIDAKSHVTELGLYAVTPSGVITFGVICRICLVVMRSGMLSWLGAWVHGFMGSWVHGNPSNGPRAKKWNFPQRNF